MDFGGVWDVRTWVDLDHVSVTHSQIVANYAVHSDLFVIKRIRYHSYAHSLLPHFTFNDHCIPLKYFELVHFLLSQFNERVVVLTRVFHKKLVGSFDVL